jgi:hypothetical protein
VLTSLWLEDSCVAVLTSLWLEDSPSLKVSELVARDVASVFLHRTRDWRDGSQDGAGARCV